MSVLIASKTENKLFNLFLFNLFYFPTYHIYQQKDGVLWHWMVFILWVYKLGRIVFIFLFRSTLYLVCPVLHQLSRHPSVPSSFQIWMQNPSNLELLTASRLEQHQINQLATPVNRRTRKISERKTKPSENPPPAPRIWMTILTSIWIRRRKIAFQPTSRQPTGSGPPLEYPILIIQMPSPARRPNIGVVIRKSGCTLLPVSTPLSKSLCYNIIYFKL